MAKTALDAPRATLFVLDPDQLTLIVDPDHPIFDPRALEPPDPAMVASIRTHGVDKPLKAFKDGDQIIVIDGRRRTVAAREAKRLNVAEGGPDVRVKVELVRCDDRGAVARMVLGNFSPKEEGVIARARKAAVLSRLNYPDDEIAILFGVSTATINNWLTVLTLVKVAQNAVERGTVRLTDAVKLAKLSRDAQPAAVAKLEQENPTRAARKASGQPAQRKPSPVGRLGRLERFLDKRPEAIPTSVMVLLNWLRGSASDGQLAGVIPELEAMFTANTLGGKSGRATADGDEAGGGQADEEPLLPGLADGCPGDTAAAEAVQ